MLNHMHAGMHACIRYEFIKHTCTYCRYMCIYTECIVNEDIAHILTCILSPFCRHVMQ